MKSRISSCNTVLKKDIARFAPLWGIYLVGGLLIMLSSINGSRPDINARNLGEIIGPFSTINLIYAGLCAFLLFGDLFNSRLCNALHAMPLKRKDWFFSHIFAGILFSLIPNTIGMLLLLPRLGGYWLAGLFWLLGMTLHFLFFFGLAVFSVMCTGSRFAAATVYGICNFLSILILWFLMTIYEPLLFGISFGTELSEIFQIFSPATFLVGVDDLLVFTRYSGTWYFTGLSAHWIYLAVIAVVGILFSLLALVLYRRRALESAGDFLAVPALGPVFSVIYTLTVAAVFSVVGELFLTNHTVFFTVGFFIGYFTGQMLLHRTVKVFRPKQFIRCLIFGALLIASLVLTWLDPLGITRYIPEKEQIQAIYIRQPVYAGNNNTLRLSDPEDVEDVLQLHQKILDRGTISSTSGRPTFSLEISYHLTNGVTVTRSYVVVQEDYSDTLRSYFSDPGFVFGYANYETFRSTLQHIEIIGTTLEKDAAGSLLDAMVQDGLDGKLAQHWSFHGNASERFSITVATQSSKLWITIFDDCTATIEWLKDHFDLWAPTGSTHTDFFQ